MNLDSLSFALSQISYSVANLTKKNFKSNITEISNLVAQYKSEAYRYLIRCLFSHVDFSGDGRSSGKDLYQSQYLIQECEKLIGKPNFVSVFCFAIDSPLQQQKSLRPSAHLFTQLSKVLKLTCVQEVAFGLAALKSSSQETRRHATQWLKQKLPQLLNVYIESGTTSTEGGLRDAPIEVIHLILSRLLSDVDRETFAVSAEQKIKFIKALSRDYPREVVPVALAPIIYPEITDFPLNRLIPDSTMSTNMMAPSVAEVIMEIGYSFTKGVDQCRSTLMQVGAKSLTAASVAQVLGLMAKLPSGFSDHVSLQNPASGWTEVKDSDSGQVTSWNVEVFVKVVKELAPNISWLEVVKELDHPGFMLQGKSGLELLMQGLSLGLGENETFPVEVIYSLWKNKEGQLSFIANSLKNTEVFCFADFPYRASLIDCLKALPDDENRDIAIWKSLDLMDILLQLSEEGLLQQVMDLFKYPVAHCPDLLLLGLLQLARWNTLKRDIVTALIPIFLGNHPNSVTVMQFAWQCQNQSQTIRTLILQAMSDWYMRDIHDQVRLCRVLDVAQDLKALSTLLNGTTYAFVIDLACLASRREYLKLDKWLTDKIREHREPFVQSCVTFLSTRCPLLVGKDELLISQIKSQQLQTETVTVMLTCLQNCLGERIISNSELQESIISLVNNANIWMNAKKPMIPGVGMPGMVGQRTGLPAPLPGLPVPMGSQSHMDPLATAAAINAIAAAASGVNVSGINTPYPTGMPALGSPAKHFSQAGPNYGPLGQTQSGFGNMQSITSQLQGMSLQNVLNNVMTPGIGGSMGTGLGTGFGPGLGGGLTMVNRGGTGGSVGGLGNQAAINQQLQRMEGLRPGSNQTGEAATTQQFSKDVEDEANSYFQRIYNNTSNSLLSPMSVDQALELLKTFKDSAHDRDKEVFQCMLRNLFEEYRFFSQYPDKELQTTAVLFGGIIEQGLVTYLTLGMALRSVLEALKRSQGSKMYMFGLTSLDRFKTRLREYPQYCQFLASIPHFQDFPPILKEYIEYGARSMDPPHASLTPTAVVSSATPIPSSMIPAVVTTQAPPPPPPTQSTHGIISRPVTSAAPSRASIAGATNIDTLLANKEGVDGIVVPPEALQDKVFFIFNNLSQSNMDQKAGEMKEAVGDEFMAWVAQYLVMKRASIEHNFHTLYANFIDYLKKSEFIKMVVKETYRNIKVLLRSDKGVANFSDRTLLKNLGHWLGMLTLAKNKPVLYVDIDLKSLIYEAYHKGSQELLYVVPFVAKIVESAQKSRVFKPPNPWTMAIMNVLAELHIEQEIRLNLKFEIEVLCKNLAIDVNDLIPGNYLKDLTRLAKLEHQLSPPSKPKDSATPQPEEPLQINMPTPTTAMMTQSIISNPSAVPVAPVTSSVGAPLQPQFGYNEINLNIATLSQHIVINEQIALFQAHPQLKQFIRPAIERAVQEMIAPAIDRAIKIALTTSEQIVKKDFALDPDETHLRTAAHNLVRFMTAGMALIMCHEPVLINISNTLKTFFVTAIRGATQQQKDMIEQAAQVIAADNTELATVYLQKTAVEKALPEIDKRLASDFEARKVARNEGRRYFDPMVLKYQMDRMPEEIRLKQGGVSSHQLTVYDEFSHNIPGFLPIAVEAGLQSLPYMVKSAQLGPDDIVLMYDKIARELEQHLLAFLNHPLMSPLRTLLEYVLLARNSVRDINSALALLQRAVEGLLEGMALSHCEPDIMARYRDCHLVVLRALQDPRVYGPQWTNKQVTRCLIECREELRFSIDAVDCLLRSQLVLIPQYDLHLAQLVESGINFMAIAFAMQLVQRFCIDGEKGGQCVQEGEFNNTIEALTRVALHSRQPPDGLTTLLDAVRQRNGDIALQDRTSFGPTSMMHSGINQAREFDDPPGLHDKTEFLLREWVSLYHSPAAGRDSAKAFSSFVAQMHFHGILKTDDLITRFFRLCTEMCVDLCYRALAEPTQSVTRVRVQCFHTLDAFVRLIVLLLKHSGDTTNTATKINLLNKVLGIVAGVLLQDHEVRRTDFQQLPYHRIFIMLFIELNNPEPVLDSINYEVLQAYCNTLHILRPNKAPGFAFAWLELVSHRVFIGRMLALTPQQRAWGMYAQMLIDLFKFLAPFLRNADLSKPLQLLYKGTMRVLLVMLHDFPEFLCDYHYTFCDAIPSNCIQVRNLILSAFPRSMRLPDPFTPNLKVDMLPEITNAPRIVTNFVNMIQPSSLKKDLDSYLLTRSPVTFLSDLRSKLQVSNSPGMKYNIPLMNSIVLHVGTQAISHIHKKGLTPSMSTIAHSSHMDIFQNLAVDLDTEGRYLFLNAMANQLRYPNSHTHYFSCTLLYLFAEANTEAIQEQITRVLLERLIVNRPHPWGLLITFIELIKNPQFKFWNHEFVRCAPEIEKLLDSVARSCMQSKSTMRDQEGPEMR